MKRCTRCILPECYPGVTFNEAGVCNHCIAHREREYLGSEALREKIESFLRDKEDRNKSYDILVGFSGGRDSTYLLYYLTKVLNFKVLAYFVDNGFVPEQTRRNIENTTGVLNVKLVREENENLKKCLKHHISSWMYRPSPAMVGMLCVGCRLGMRMGIRAFATKSKIPVIISGGTPFEVQEYKYNLLKLNPNSNNRYSTLLGYLSQVTRNPRWVLNPTCLITQIKEYYYHYRPRISKQEGLLYLRPFADYIRWNESKVVSTIKNELNWEENPRAESTWRGDCEVALLKLHLYKKTLGFNDRDDGLSCLIRDNQISREEALERLETEGEIPEEAIKELFDKLGLNHSQLRCSESLNVRLAT